MIARRIREIGVYCEIHPFDADEQFIREFNPKGIIFSGGPETVTTEITPRIPEFMFELGCPLLGICYGMQAMTMQLGGQVKAGHKSEFGFARVDIHGHCALLREIDDHVDEQGVALLDVWMSHGDQVVQVPEGFTCTLYISHCNHAT